MSKLSGSPRRFCFHHCLKRDAGGVSSQDVDESFEPARADAFDQVESAGGPPCFLGDCFARETGQYLAICTINHFHDFGSESPGLAAVGLRNVCIQTCTLIMYIMHTRRNSM